MRFVWCLVAGNQGAFPPLDEKTEAEAQAADHCLNRGADEGMLLTRQAQDHRRPSAEFALSAVFVVVKPG